MSEPGQEVVIRCEGLHRYLGEGEGRVHVLRGVTFEAKRGHVYAIVGPSGCGKSTLLYQLGLLDQPDGGKIWLDGELMSNSSDHARTAARNKHLGFVFQFHFLMLEFSALENVMMPLRKAGHMSQAEMEERAHHLLDSVGLGEKTHRLGTQLSGGEQQRVAIARALANSPSVILADEPTGNLDQSNGSQIMDLIFGLKESLGVTLIMVTHDMNLAQRCDRIIPLRDGMIDAG